MNILRKAAQRINKQNQILFSVIFFMTTLSVVAQNSSTPLIKTAKPLIKSDSVQTDIEIISVTASKRKQSLQQIPMTINALTAQNIIDRQITDMDKVLTQFANLSANSTTELATGFTIRGIGTNNPHGNVNQAVGIYRDEISYGSPYSGILGVYDTERIEILRGPQNSLFGRNTTGGAIHFMSAKPSIGDDSNSGYLMASAGRFNQIDLTGALNMPVTDNMAFRFSGESVQRDGIYTNLATDAEGVQLGEKTLGDKHRQSARIQYAWQPEESTEILVNYHYAKHDGTNIGNRAFGTRDVNDPSLIINGAQDIKDDIQPDNRASISPFIFSVDANNTNVINTVDRNGDNPATGDWHNIYNVSSARSYANINGGFIKINHQFDNDYQLQLTSSFDKTLIETADETSGSNSLQFIPNRDITYEQKSHELRLLSPDDKDIRWLAGLYHFNEDMELYTIVRRFNYAGPNSNLPRDVSAFNILSQEDKDFSIYGHIDWQMTNKLILSSGLRYTENNKRADSSFGVAANYNSPPVISGNEVFNTREDLIFDLVSPDAYLGKTFINNCYSADFVDCTVIPNTKKDYQLKQDLSEWGGKVALDYQQNINRLIYVSYAKGFKSGGFDTRALAAFFGEGADQAFLPEYIDAYEFGVKSKLSKSLQVNSTLFYSEWRDLQTFGIFNGEPRYVNIPVSIIKGVESELKWVPKKSWYTQLSVGLLNTEIIDNGSLTAADEGHELSNSPAITINLLLKKQFRVGADLLTLETDARYVSEQVDSLTFDRDAFSTKDSQLWLNARARYQFGHDHQYNIAVWAENLTEETYCVDIGLQNVITRTTTEADTGPRGIDLTSTITCQPSATSGERFIGISLGVNF